MNPFIPKKDFPKGVPWFSYFSSLAMVMLIIVFGWFAQEALVPTDLIMFYLLAVVIIALNFGRGPAILASIASALAFDFFFVYPKFSFTVFNRHDLITLAGFLIVGLIIGTLAARLRESLLKAQQIELLHEKEKLQSILLNSISHDLRTPLSSIAGALSRLLDMKGIDEETHHELIEIAYGESARLNRLVGNLLDMTKVEAGALPISFQPCDVSDLIGVSLRELPKKQIENRPIRIRVSEKLPEVALDFTLMTKVLANIIDNALKYSPSDSPVDIEAKLMDGELRFEVSDHGVGIPANELSRIFDKFYRGKRSQKVPGTGLGLSICKGIVEVHQGKIWARSRLPRGTKISISLPIARSQDD